MTTEADLAARARRKTGTRGREFVDRHFLILASWPALVAMLAVTAVPFVVTIGMGFTNYNLVAPTWHFIGFQNFVELFRSPQTWPIIFNTFYIVIGLTVLSTAIGLLLAILMKTAFRGIRVV